MQRPKIQNVGGGIGWNRTQGLPPPKFVEVMKDVVLPVQKLVTYVICMGTANLKIDMRFLDMNDDQFMSDIKNKKNLHFGDYDSMLVTEQVVPNSSIMSWVNKIKNDQKIADEKAKKEKAHAERVDQKKAYAYTYITLLALCAMEKVLKASAEAERQMGEDWLRTGKTEQIKFEWEQTWKKTHQYNFDYKKPPNPVTASDSEKTLYTDLLSRKTNVISTIKSVFAKKANYEDVVRLKNDLNKSVTELCVRYTQFTNSQQGNFFKEIESLSREPGLKSDKNIKALSDITYDVIRFATQQYDLMSRLADVTSGLRALKAMEKRAVANTPVSHPPAHVPNSSASTSAQPIKTPVKTAKISPGQAGEVRIVNGVEKVWKPETGNWVLASRPENAYLLLDPLGLKK
jgi:hypothetical protein